MCFSAQASLASFLVGIIGCVFVYNLKNRTQFDIILALYIGYVSIMQGIEFLLWSHQKCDDYHKLISKMGMVLNSAQPLVLCIILLFISPRFMKNIHPILLIILSYSLYAFFYFKQYTGNLQCTVPRPDDPHLVWNWNIMSSYHIWWAVYISTVVLISILGMPTLMIGSMFAFFASASLGLSILLYPRQDVGALWCFFTSLTPPLYYFYRVIQISHP